MAPSMAPEVLVQQLALFATGLQVNKAPGWVCALLGCQQRGELGIGVCKIVGIHESHRVISFHMLMPG